MRVVKLCVYLYINYMLSRINIHGHNLSAWPVQAHVKQLSDIVTASHMGVITIRESKKEDP